MELEPNQARRFLSALWPHGVPEGQRLLLWTFPNKRSHWPQTVGEAVRTAMKLAPRFDVYLGVGAGRRPKRNAERRRLKASKILTLPAFAADFDLAGPGHEKASLFRSEEEILELIRTLPLQPTTHVHTGGGIHAWWMFHEPWEFESDDDRAKAEALSRGWASFLRSEARARKRELDAVWDLDVLRLPGTLNHKLEKPRSVRLEQA